MAQSKHASILEEYKSQYPALINFVQAAEIAQCPLGTIYEWSSRGHFNGFKSRCGRSCRLFRDDYVMWYVTRPDLVCCDQQ